MIKLSLKKLSLAVVSAAALYLSGCANDNALSQGPFTTWENNYQRLQALTFYKVDGRLGIIAPDNRVSSNYELEGISGGFVFTIRAPIIGSSLAVATVTDNTLSLTIGEKTFKDDYAAAMFEQAFGLKIPTDKLKAILLGIADGKRQYNEEGRIISSNWDGFDISYDGIVENSGLKVPQNINIRYGDYRVKATIASFSPKQSI